VLGLALFLYAVGVQYGKEFFRGFASAEGRKANLVALIGVLAAGAVTLALVGGKVKLGYALGLFAGSGTSTPTLQAAGHALGNDPAVGYSVAYPFGVAGPILFLYFGFRILKPVIEAPAGAGQELLEIAIHNPNVIGKRLGELLTTLPAGVQIVAVRKENHNQPAVPELVLGADNVILAVGASKDALEQVRAQLGEATTGRITSDRRDLDYLRVFVSRTAVVGRALGALAPPEGTQFLIMHARRGDADLLARPDLVLEFGDRVGLLTARESFPAVRTFFGDSIKGTAEFS
jgi:putative transport protein